MNLTPAMSALYGAAAAGLGIVLWWARRARSGKDPLGPRPPGDLPATGWAVLIALPAWVLLPSLAVSAAAAAGLSDAAAATVGASAHAAIGVVLLAFVRRGAPQPTLSAGRLAATGLLAGIATFGAVALVGEGIQQVYAWAGAAVPQQGVVQVARAAGGADWTWIVVGTVGLAPFGEEVFFRGALLPALARSMPVGKAILFQGAIFGLVHVVAAPPAMWPLAIPLALVGAILGWLYVRTGSLPAAIVVHAFFNAMNLAVLRLS